MAFKHIECYFSLPSGKPHLPQYDRYFWISLSWRTSGLIVTLEANILSYLIHKLERIELTVRGFNESSVRVNDEVLKAGRTDFVAFDVRPSREK